MSDRKNYIPLVVVLTTVLCGIWFVSYRKWEELTIPYSQCEKYIADSRGLIDTIEDFKRQNGRFPRDLAEIEKGSVPNSISDRVTYQSLAIGGYQIEIETLVGLTDSYDAMFYRPDKSYPESWKKRHKTYHMGDWLYVIGAQHIHRN